MTNFELWVKACEEFKTGIYKLTHNPEDGHGVYKTVREYYPLGSYNTAIEFMYHLWWHDKHEIVSESFIELYKIFENREKNEYKAN